LNGDRLDRAVKPVLSAWLVTGMVAFALSGCGQKGPLYIPDPVEGTSETGAVLKADPEEDEESKSESE